MRLTILLAVAIFVAAAPAAVAAPAMKRCPDDKSARCGSIRVPLYRGAPDGGGARLLVKFRVYPRKDRSRPALEPIVAAEGGPGYSTVDTAPSYLFMIGPLHRRHDLIVMDNRGTGHSGAINCPRLQAGKGVYATEAGRCARRLGARANAYGTGAAADDLADVLDKLGVRQPVGLYGDSYGTYFAQTFAVRHPDRVRAVVLDAAFAVDGFDPWIRQESVSLRYAWPQVCLRSTGCGGDVLSLLGRMATRLESRPLRGTSRDADGGRHRVKVDGGALGQMTGDGSFYYTIYRDMAAALRAFRHGDRAPLLRLAAEDLPFTGGGPITSYSEGAYVAVACHDYPTLWDPAAPFPTRRDQLAAARAGLAPDTYAPFRNDIWLRSLYIDQQVTGCLRWPAPKYPDPPVPPGAPYPDVPVLVLDGDVDLITPLGDAASAAHLFPNSTLVTVRNVGHVTGLADYNGCAAGIVRRFLTTAQTGDVGCAARYPEIHVVPEFPRRVAAAPGADQAGARDRSRPADRRAAWAASLSVGDALARWWLMYGSSGHGLRGGTFEASGDYLSYEPVELKMRRVRFVGDLAASGVVVWDRSLSTVRARLRLRGARTGRLHVGWSTKATRATAFIHGRLGGRQVRLRMPAP